jgi:DNA-binding XRE family transcriptional regulator
MSTTKSASSAIANRWDSLDYEFVIDARYEPRTLIVDFADGTEARIDVDQLGAYGIRDDQWPRVRADEIHVSVPRDADEIEIPWDVLRYVSDPEFRVYWDEVMTSAQRNLGNRLRELRVTHGLSVADLATRAGIDGELLRQIESGETAVSLTLEDELLSAMGCSFEDLR